MICRITATGRDVLPTTQWHFDQVALRFLCGSDIIIFTFWQNNIKGRPVLNSRATDSTLEEPGDHVRQKYEVTRRKESMFCIKLLNWGYTWPRADLLFSLLVSWPQMCNESPVCIFPHDPACFNQQPQCLEGPWAENKRRLDVMVTQWVVWNGWNGHDFYVLPGLAVTPWQEILTMPKYNFIFLKLNSISPRHQVFPMAKSKPK